MDALIENWNKALEMLREDITSTAYDAWIAPLVPKNIDEKQNILYVEAENDFVISRLNDRYLQILEGAVGIAFKNQYKVVARLAEKRPYPEKKPVAQPEEKKFAEEYYLNPRYNFESFVVGKNNEYAYSAALAVAESPAKQYNPLFIYGGSGLGKTHLMHAIGHYILKNSEDMKVLYVSSEMFTNELINAIREKRTSEFKKKYRAIDVLLIDDIQFIEGKDSVQEEFFHTFNTLYDRNKQIIISSDRPPNKLNSLDERLTGRFLWSITADIQPPDYETRVAILMNKAEFENIEITEDIQEVINLISEKIKYNVRELEGAFTRIISFSTLLKRPVNLALAKDTLKEILSSNDMKISTESIKRIVCKHFNIKIKDIESAKRNREFAYPRQIAMYLSKEMTDSSYPKIGKAFGGKDHTTVIHACKKISSELKTDETLRETINELTLTINEN